MKKKTTQKPESLNPEAAIVIHENQPQEDTKMWKDGCIGLF